MLSFPNLPGAALIPYSLPCLRELFRFLISLTNPHDRHNTDAMMHMGLQLLTVALEAAHIAPYQSLLGLVKDELCRHLFQVSYTTGLFRRGTFYCIYSTQNNVTNVCFFSISVAKCGPYEPVCRLRPSVLLAL